MGIIITKIIWSNKKGVNPVTLKKSKVTIAFKLSSSTYPIWERIDSSINVKKIDK